MNDALEIQGLQKSYPNFELSQIDLRVPKGCIMGLIGQNGAGKSTMIKSILNLIHKDNGTITFWGKSLDEEGIREQIGVVFDETALQLALTPEKLGKISQKAYRNWDMELYYQYLEQFHLDRKKKIKEFSRGMQVKLSISLALAHHPKLLILDEATSGLDPIVRDDILDLFLEFVQSEENSILMSSHITSDLEKVADYITFIHNGSILFSKEKDELVYTYGIARCKEVQFQQIDKSDMLAWKKEDYQYNVLLKDRRRAAQKYKDLVVDVPNIDEIMLMYVKGKRV